MSHVPEFSITVYRIDRPDGRQRFVESAEEPVVDLGLWGTVCTRIDTAALTPEEAVILRAAIVFDAEWYLNVSGLRTYLAWILDPVVRRAVVLEEAGPTLRALRREIVQAPFFEDEGATEIDRIPAFATGAV